jgi:hypothetical protein
MTDNDSTNMTVQPRRSNAWHAIGVLIAMLLIKMGAYVALSGLAAFLVYFLCYISVSWWNIGTEKVATAKLENAYEISQAVLAQAQRMLRKIESRHSLARNVSSLGAYLLIMSPLLFIPARTYFSILLTFVAILAVVALVSFMRQMMASKKMIKQLKNLGYAEIASMKSEHEARKEAYQKSSAEYAQNQRDQEVLKARINFMRG